MKQFLTLLSVIFLTSCMNDSVTPPIAEKQPYEMIKHNDVRVDDYYWMRPVSYTHLRAHETEADLVCRLLLEKS